MTSNMGSIDKWIRMTVGVIIVVLGIIFKSWWGLLGLLPLLTAGMNFCPLYSLLKFSSKKSKPE